MDSSLYGRKWEMKITCTDGDTLTLGNDGFSGTESLKVTFDINYPRYEALYLATFEIWNPTVETERKIIMEGAEVEFSAGYSQGNYGLIFKGSVFQPLFTRERVVDYKLTLMCVDGHLLYKDNFASFTLRKEYHDMTLINELAARSKNPIPVNRISSEIDQTKKPRGVVVFSAPSNKLREITRSNGAQSFVVNNQLNIEKTKNQEIEGQEIVINPQTGLIGTPQQVDYGIEFKTLLNPNLVLAYPAKWVKLDLSEVTVQLQRSNGPSPNNAPVPIIPAEGNFLVASVRHHGDTRGNDWYTDVVGYSLAGKMDLRLITPEMLQGKASNPN